MRAVAGVRAAKKGEAACGLARARCVQGLDHHCGTPHCADRVRRRRGGLHGILASAGVGLCGRGEQIVLKRLPVGGAEHEGVRRRWRAAAERVLELDPHQRPCGGLPALFVHERRAEGEAARHRAGRHAEGGQLRHDEAVLLGEGEQQVHGVLLVEDAW